jgi:hypothetical protein
VPVDVPQPEVPSHGDSAPSFPPPPSYPTYPPPPPSAPAGADGYPPAPGYPPPYAQQQVEAPPPPRELHHVVVLLIANLVLSITLTVAVLLLRHSVVNYQLDHRHITDPAQRAALRDSYVAALIGRVIGNIVVSVVYAFLVRALFRGRRWAYRRVIWIGAAGAVTLLLLQLTPYPTWMHVEQIVQAVVLLALVLCVLRPEVRAHFAPHLPGRNVRRFRNDEQRH